MNCTAFANTGCMRRALVSSMLLLLHQLAPFRVRGAHAGFIGGMRRFLAVRRRSFPVQSAIDEDRYVGSGMRATLHTLPRLGVVGAAKSEWTLEMFMHAQAGAVRFLGTAVHAERHMTDLGFFGGNRPQHAEKCHR